MTMKLGKFQHIKFNIILLSLTVAGLILAGCVESTVTPTTEIERAPSLEASITVAPIIPTEGDDSIGRSDPTMAGLAAEGQPSPSFEAQDTEIVATPQFVMISVIADDGQVLDVVFLSAPVRPAPTVIILKDLGEDNENWVVLAQSLRESGYNVAIPALRRAPDTPNAAYWQQARLDVRNIVENIMGINNISTGTTIVIGSTSGANLALMTCAELQSCVATVALSPQNNIASLDFSGSISAFGGRSVMIVSADDDAVGTSTAETLNNQLSGDHVWQRYSGGGQGTALIVSQPDLADRIVGWLQLRATPPGINISTPQP